MEDINNTNVPLQPIETPVTPEPTPTPSKSNIFKYLFIICFIVLLASAIYSFFLIKNLNSKLETIKPEDTLTEIIPTTIPTEEFVNEVTPTDNSTKDWKTYTNSTYKYSVQYPNNWKLTTGLSSLSKSDISLETPEEQKAQIERDKGPHGDQPGLCGFYYISCYSNIKDFHNGNFNNPNITLKSLSDYFNMEKDTISIIDKTFTKNQNTYEVNQSGLSLNKSYFIEKPDLSFCEIQICGNEEKMTGIDRQFVDTFKFTN